MLKVKFLISLFSIIFLTSCTIKLDKVPNGGYQKFDVDYLSGGESAFIFKNILKQQMIANDLFDENSQVSISIDMTVTKEYLSTSITKVATRELNGLSVTITAYRKGKEGCTLFDKTYEADQSFLIAESSANLSNIAAENDILLISSENLSLEIIDDLLSDQNLVCEVIE